jgi:hypothetical protein
MERNDLFGRSKAPSTATREGRVRMLGELAGALLAGNPPDRAAALFLGGALLAWLEHGGSLERDFLKVIKPKSHRTPRAIWSELRGAVAHQDEGRDSLTAQSYMHRQQQKESP